MHRSSYHAGHVVIHKRKTLPHWDAEAGIQFITIHLARGREFSRIEAGEMEQVVTHAPQGRYTLLAWCVMPDHLHAVIWPFVSIASIVGGWKRVTTRRLGGGTWWQKDYFDRLIRNERELDETLGYVLNNPEAAGLTDWNFRGVDWEAVAHPALTAEERRAFGAPTVTGG